MKEITKLMIKKYALNILKYDFMGYWFRNINQLSYHHLIIPKRLDGPMTIENGVILVRDTSHDYLHIIENYDYDMFLAITCEMLDQKVKGRIDIKNLAFINDILTQFEREYCGTRNAKGKLIIKEEFTKRLLKK